MKFLVFVLLFASIAFNPLLADDDDPLHPNRSAALDEFDDNMNGATMLVDDIPPVDRDALMEEHRENEDWAMEDEMWDIDDALWYEHARKKGWLDED